MNQKIIAATQVGAYWVLFSMFALGFIMTNVLLWAPWVLSPRLVDYGTNVMHVIVKTAPYSSMNASVEQLLVIGSLIDVLGVLTLLVSPKFAALGTIALTGWRQVLVRANLETLPNSPMCGYQAPHCALNDVLYFITLSSSLIVFTARKPMIETHMHFFKLFGKHAQRNRFPSSSVLDSARKTD
jgi:hypothetical protein